MPLELIVSTSPSMDGCKNEIKKVWVMIDENEDCVTKSKLAITVKIFSKCNYRSRVVAKQTNKQTQRHKNRQAFRQENKKTYLQIDTQAELQWTYAHTEVNKKLKMRPSVLLLLK